MIIKDTLSILWKINRTCNFRCSYCFDSVAVRSDPANRCSDLSRTDVRAVAASFDALPLDTHIIITGGEPFLYPDFTTMCLTLTQRHRLSLTTNLSTDNVLAFADTIDPARVGGIRCSLHLLERERLGLMQDLRQKLACFRKQGFTIYVTEVLSPPVLSRLETLAAEFGTEGIIIWPILMRGRWQGGRYPAHYSREQRRLIRRYYERLAQQDSSMLFEGFAKSERGLTFLDGQVSFKGHPCRAGMNSVFMQPNGDIQRCPDVREPLGNLFQGAFQRQTAITPCPTLVCNCPWNGYSLAHGKPRILGKYNLGFQIRQTIRDFIRSPDGKLATVTRAAVGILESRLGIRLWE